jgi:hypothetical protein
MLITNYTIILATGFSVCGRNYKMGLIYIGVAKVFKYYSSEPYDDGKLSKPPDIIYKLDDWYQYAMRVNMPMKIDNRFMCNEAEMNVREYLQSRYINVRWFTPFLHRLLHDEDVTLEEVDAAHRVAFGGMPLRYYSRLPDANHSCPAVKSIDDWLAECLSAPSCIS